MQEGSLFPSSSPSASPLVLWIPAWIFDVSRVELEVRADRWLPVVDGCRSGLHSRISEMQEREAEAECLFLRAPIVIRLLETHRTMIESDFQSGKIPPCFKLHPENVFEEFRVNHGVAKAADQFARRPGNPSLLSLLQNGSSEKREVRQFQFTAWPDHGVPEYPTPFLAFLRRVKTCNPPDAGPIIAHCRSDALGAWL